MSYFLMQNGLAAQSPLIKAKERSHFVDALSLLDIARQKADTIEAMTEAARAQAYEEGFAKGLEHAEVCLLDEIGKFAAAVHMLQADYEARVAEAAFAATSAIIGSFEDADNVSRIINTQLTKRAGDENIRIHLAPHVASTVAQTLADKDNIEIVAEADLCGTDCRIATGDGRIVADLSLQLESLRQRWGLFEAPEDQAVEA
jgi:flagellar biosynthesis/type III secretory pathway protein FliH